MRGKRKRGRDSIVPAGRNELNPISNFSNSFHILVAAPTATHVEPGLRRANVPR
jgi:hypothetical protein